MKASPISREENELLLQAWSTAMVQTTKNKTAVAPRVLNSMRNLLELTTSYLMLQVRGRARSDPGHAGKNYSPLAGLTVCRWRLLRRALGTGILGAISRALQHRQPRILRKGRIGRRELAQIEGRAAIRLHPPHETTRCAQANRGTRLVCQFRPHPHRIALAGVPRNNRGRTRPRSSS